MVGGVETGEDLGGVETGGFGEGAGDHFEGFGVFFDGVLGEGGVFGADGGDAFVELHFRGAGAGNGFRVSGDGLDDVDAVVDCALDVVEVVLGGAADDERRGAGGVVFLPEDGYAVAADLEGFYNVDMAHFVGHRGTEAGKGSGADDAAEAAELELR